MQRHIWIGLLAALLAMGCGDDDDSGNPDGSTTPDGTTGDTSVDGSFTPPANIGESITTYSQIVLASYEDSITEAMALDTALDALVAGPTDATLTAAKEAWLASREPYLQTEVYRFYDGPIDNPTDGPEGLINAWPMDEAYVDYVAGMDMAGIINDPAAVPMINAASIEPLNEVGGEENVATGYHPIEFLLWGQDMDPAGPGNRPFTDYVTGGTGTAANQDRRGQYLQTASELLLRDLTQVRDAWAEGSTTNYRATFESADPLESFGNILTGMIILSGFETGGERLQTALDSGDQEDEHSCFSDNTHRDMVGDCIGIQNVYEGRYQRLD
ncbi:MAG: imelysin family protein, partial [Myxococcota bacterium]